MNALMFLVWVSLLRRRTGAPARTAAEDTDPEYVATTYVAAGYVEGTT